jgi:hypothetical protein
MSHIFKLTIATALFGFILCSTASAKPKYWVIRATLACLDCGSSDTAPAIIGNRGDYITSRAKCERLKSELVAMAKKNSLKAKAQCIATNNPTKEN